MRKETPRFVAAVAIIILCAHSHQSGYAAAPFFAGLGFLPGGSSGGASAVSADGSIVVGSANSSNSSPGYGEAFRWTQSAGMVGLGDRPGGSFISNAWGVSGDGSVVAGEGTYGNYFAGEHEAFRWTQATGMVGLGDLAGGSFTSTAHGISADGSTIVGQGTSATRQEAFRWTQGTGMVGLGVLSGGSSSIAAGASANGLVVVGSSGAAGIRSEAFRWTQATGMVGLGDLPGSEFYSEARNVSADGLVVVGDSTSANSGFGYFEAFRWTEADGMVGLGDLPGGLFYSVANAVSGGGSVIVGSGHTDSGFQATIWDATHGTRNLRDVLVNDYGMGASLAGWELASATGISADGLTIVGTGSSPSSGSEAFLVHLNSPVPEPSTVVLFALGVAFYMGTRRICTARTRP